MCELELDAAFLAIPCFIQRCTICKMELNRHLRRVASMLHDAGCTFISLGTLTALRLNVNTFDSIIHHHIAIDILIKEIIPIRFTDILNNLLEVLGGRMFELPLLEICFHNAIHRLGAHLLFNGFEHKLATRVHIFCILVMSVISPCFFLKPVRGCDVAGFDR
ncbi:hypothetical protein D3C72_1908030 [compost metagenome]